MRVISDNMMKLKKSIEDIVYDPMLDNHEKLYTLRYLNIQVCNAIDTLELVVDTLEKMQGRK